MLRGFGVVLSSVVLAFTVAGCRTFRPRDGFVLPSLSGRWVGTFHQYDDDETYPMAVDIQPINRDEFLVTTWWSSEGNVKTEGRGEVRGDNVYWTETRKTRGSNVVLGGHYVAGVPSRKHLSGRYLRGSEPIERGRFELRRASD
jgi:hypothetical protein